MRTNPPSGLIFLISAVSLPLQALAADEAARPHSPVVGFLYAVLPLLLMGGLLWWFLRRSQRTSSLFMKRSIEHYERSEQHMQQMRQFAERIAIALEKVAERPEQDGSKR